MKAEKTEEYIGKLISIAFGQYIKNNKELHDEIQIVGDELDRLYYLAEIGEAVETAFKADGKPFLRGLWWNKSINSAETLLEWYRQTKS